MPIFRTSLIILMLVITHPAICQQRNIRFEHLGMDQGLSQSNVTAILQDSRGFMWFGTRDGLNKYNGYGFTIFKKIAGDTRSLSNNFITSIVEDSAGNLWIGTWGGGLNRFDRETDAFTHYTHLVNEPNSLANDFINKVVLDKAGNLWIGTDGGGLNILDRTSGKFLSYSHNDKDPTTISDNDVTDIFFDHLHRTWVATYHGGLNLFDRQLGRFLRYRHDSRDSSSLASDIVSSIFEDSRHWLWIGTKGGGLDRFDTKQKAFCHFKHDAQNVNTLPHNVIATIAEDAGGLLWIGTENGGLGIMDPENGRFHNYQHDEIDNASLGHNSVDMVYKDATGNMWLGTYSNGVDHYNRDANKFTTYKHNSSPNSLSNNSVLCLFEDTEKDLWVGTDGGGLGMLNRESGDFTQFRHHPNSNGIGGDYVLIVREDSEKQLWIGTWGDGMTRIDKTRKRFQQYKHDPARPGSLGGNNVYAIAEDKDKLLWIGTYGEGLNRYDRAADSFQHYRHQPDDPGSLSSDRIHTLLADRQGALWVGTFDGGLDCFNKKTNTFTHYSHDDRSNSLSNNSVNALYENANGDLWIGTVDGLNFLDRKTGKFTSWFAKDGLPNSVIFGILEDAKGNIWVSTNGGLSKFNPHNGTFTNYFASDGLQSSEFKAHSCFKNSAGMMYFGGVNGFNEFSPDSIRENTFEFPLVITSFQIFNKEVPISADNAPGSPLHRDIAETGSITLSYKQSVISFEFASLNYSLPGKRQYTYRLQGFDNKWNYIGLRHSATYTNLDPGEYTFEVKGMKNDGSWSPATTRIQLVITPPCWKTWWFRSIMVLILVWGVIAFYRIRMKMLTTQKKELEERVIELDKAVAQGKFEIASDVLHDIGNAIVGFGSHLTRIRRLQEEIRPEVLEKLAVFFETCRPAMQSVVGEAKSGAVIEMLHGLSATQQTNQEEIGRSVTEQLHIINHMQEILQIQRQYISGKSSQERTPVNLRSILNDCMAMMLTTFDNKGIDVSMDIPPDLPLIKGDRTRLMQVFLHLLKNSVDAIEKEAPVKTIGIKMQGRQNTLIMAIRDSGHGFDDAVASRLFEKGFTTKDPGSGLGLYNCLDIMESHEGTIELTSDGHGKGALAIIIFTIIASPGMIQTTQ